MASASSAACQATSMTNKIRQQWRQRHMRERAASQDFTHGLLSPVSETEDSNSMALQPAIPDSGGAVPVSQSVPLAAVPGRSRHASSPSSLQTSDQQITPLTSAISDTASVPANPTLAALPTSITQQPTQPIADLDRNKSASHPVLSFSFFERFYGFGYQRQLSNSSDTEDGTYPGRRRHSSGGLTASMSSTLSGDANIDSTIVPNE